MQDYKHIRHQSEKRETERKGSKKTSMLALMLLGVIVASGFYFTTHQAVANKIKKIVTPAEPNLPAEKRFTFYDILARGETIINSDIPVEVNENKIYVQLGAFKNDIDADNFEAKMKLLDLHPQVQSLSLPEKGGRWFIVRIGPIKDDNELSMIKTQLSQNKVEFAMVTKSN